MFDESKHPRDAKGRFTDGKRSDSNSNTYKAALNAAGYDTTDMSDEWAEHLAKDISIEYESGAISGAVSPDSDRAVEHAIRFYEEMRHRNDDITSISKNTGYSPKTILKIKNYIFLEKHHLSTGYMHFEPNFDMALSWQRLISGKFVRADITLLKHELMEMELVKIDMPQQQAHDLTNKIYNYSAEINEWRRKEYGNNKKNRR